MAYDNEIDINTARKKLKIIDNKMKNVTTDSEISGEPNSARLSDEQMPLELTQGDPNDPFSEYNSLGSLSSRSIINLIEKSQQESKGNRKKRYSRHERAHGHPEIEGSLNIYADESTMEDYQGKIFHIQHPDKQVKKEIENLFERINLPDKVWQISWNMCGYGDEFYHIKINKTLKKIIGVNWIPREAIDRIEENGTLTGFQLNKENLTQSDAFKYDYNYRMDDETEKTIFPFEILHFKIPSNKYGVYGKSIIDSVIDIADKLALMEKAMLLSRVTRAPERRIYSVDVGKLQGNHALKYAHDAVNFMKKKRRINPFGDDNSEMTTTKDVFGNVEDIVIPKRAGSEGNAIDTLPQSQVQEPTDLEFVRDRLFPGLAIPRQYLYDDTFANANLNLSSKSIQFARRIRRVQRFLLYNIYKLSIIQLKLAGYSNADIDELTVMMNNPSTIAEKERIDIETQKWTLVSTIKQLNQEGETFFPDHLIYKDIMNYDDSKIIEMYKLNELQNQGTNPYNAYDKDEKPEEAQSLSFGGAKDEEEGGGGPIPGETADQMADAGIKPTPPPEEQGGGEGEAENAEFEIDTEKMKPYTDEEKFAYLLQKKNELLTKIKEENDDFEYSYDDLFPEQTDLKRTKITTSNFSMDYIENSGDIDGFEETYGYDNFFD